MTREALSPRFTVCGIDELALHQVAGVTHVLSILDPDWPAPEALAVYEASRRLQLRFHDIIDPRPGWVAPERADVEWLLAFGGEPGQAAHLLVHCHAGVSRSTAAAALILAERHPENSATATLDTVLRLRPKAWPNLRMLEFGDELLGRGGEIVDAAARLYRKALARDPTLALAMTMNGRGREVAAAARSLRRKPSQRS
jgi:predicted protein tyrosine phosphatase